MQWKCLKDYLRGLTNWKLHSNGKTSIKGLLITKLRMQSTFSTFFSPLFGYLMLIAFFALSTSFTSVAVFFRAFCLISHTRSSRRKLTSTIRDKWEKSLNLKRRQCWSSFRMHWLIVSYIWKLSYISCSFAQFCLPRWRRKCFPLLSLCRKPFRRLLPHSKQNHAHRTSHHTFEGRKSNFTVSENDFRVGSRPQKNGEKLHVRKRKN